MKTMKTGLTKKMVAMLAAAALLASAMGTTALAAGASVSITNHTSVQQGKSYTYTISVKITSSMDFIGTIKFSGIFSHDTIYLDYHPSSNSSTTLTEKVTFKIPADAELDSVGKITVTGQGDYLNGDGQLVEYKVSKSLTAKVVAPVASTPKPAPAVNNAVQPGPSPEPKLTVWDAAAISVASTANGALRVDAGQDSRIPVALLRSLKEMRSKLAVDLGNCTCTVDGATLAQIPAAGSIDLAVAMDRNEAISAAARGMDLYQLHFAHSGQLPGPLAYRFKAASSKPGDTLYLYCYYEQPGVVEGICSSVVDEEGFVAFTVWQCSSYFVTGDVIPGAAGSLADAAGARQAALEAQACLDGMQARLDAAESDAARLKELLGQQEIQLLTAVGDAAVLKAAGEGVIGVTPGMLAVCAGALVLLSALVTTLLVKAALFSRKAVQYRYPIAGNARGNAGSPRHAGRGDSLATL